MSADDGKGDPDATRLLERVMDKLDQVLFLHGFEFREDQDWAAAGGEIEKYIFKYYDDLTGGDEDYDPNAPPDKSSSVEVEGDVSSDETSGSETLESDTAEEVQNAKKPRKH